VEEMVLGMVTLRDMIEVSACRIWELGTDLQGVVYLAQSPVALRRPTVLKIGFTRSPIQRISQLCERFGGDVCLEHVIWTDDPSYLERRLHDVFHAQWTEMPKGAEWFTLTDVDREWFAQFEAINTWILKDCIDEPESTYIYRENMDL